MKNLKVKPYILPLLLLLTVICLAFGFGFSKSADAFSIADAASADTAKPAARLYSHTYLSRYAVEMDIKSDRSIAVTEDISVFYYNNSGFIRDIPVNGGEQVKNVNVREITDGVDRNVYFNVFVEDNDFVSIDIGDSAYKNNEHTYRITYDYCLTKAQEGNNLLALTPVGGGWECEIENVSVKLLLPDGYITGSAKCFSQRYGVNDYEQIFTTDETVENGKTVITTTSVISLNGNRNEALRIDLNFEEGALTTYFDFTPYWFIIAGAVLLLITVAVKFLFFNKRMLVPVVNFEAPNKMDPLLMGKLIDNKVNSEDITSMIFYWADKGYLKINFDDQKDPSLIRTIRTLPEGSPAYEVIMFAEMFNGQDAIKTSMLRYKFFTTIDKVTKMVNNQTKGLYDKASVAVSFALMIIAGLLTGIAPIILAFTQISHTYLTIIPLISIVPHFFVYALSQSIMNNSLKIKNGVKIGILCGIAAFSAVYTLIYTFLISPAVMGTLPKVLLCLICCGVSALSVLNVQRSESYTSQLNEIVGFKNFIRLAEKDRLEKMIEDDPEFYYHILPYAQVLGVSDVWEDKFKGIDVRPPQWATSSNNVLDFIILNRIMRVSMASVRSNLASRPSSSGSSGGGHSSFGGFSGGGHGGGGGRFR